MSNWIEDLREIYKILEKHGFYQLKEELFETQLSGGTGWEIFLLVTTKLRDIEYKNPEVYELIKKKSDSIFDFGIKNGFLKKK
ncbi:hypothetical protein MQE36_01630 [Zhouia spongiae]|uniref:Uncharacterized protein n=1 Tax=Zhouia spongiae TaxID=2202721 RepID=A0ABY3YNA1_9FLAO|nr:hypothetical protein [Zhouia spongiae]UNY99062.1 hypothetical protein MQE36_01630 [Zhouia spongiae]